MSEVLLKLLSMQGLKDFFVLTDGDDNYDTVQIVTSIIQLVMMLLIIGTIGYFFA